VEAIVAEGDSKGKVRVGGKLCAHSLPHHRLYASGGRFHYYWLGDSSGKNDCKCHAEHTNQQQASDGEAITIENRFFNLRHIHSP
jgi:hypothetical protein